LDGGFLLLLSFGMVFVYPWRSSLVPKTLKGTQDDVYDITTHTWENEHESQKGFQEDA
jgi:hypothetical protein